MAPDHDDEPAPDDTVVVPAEEITQADEEWPVAEQYRIGPGTASSAPAAPATGEMVVVTQDRRTTPRRFPPPVGPGVLVAIAGAVAALILIALLAQLRGGDATTEPPTTAVTTTPAGGGTTTPSSAGKITLVDVEGLPLARARDQLEKARLRVKVERSPSTRPRDEVLTQSPEADATVAKHDLIVLVVSNGKSPKPSGASVTVPGVVGLSASDAVVAIRDAGLDAKIHLVESSEPAGTVLRQSPAEDANTTRGSTIRLDVAKTRTAPTILIDVPDVVDGSVADARRQLRSFGLTVTVVHVRSDERAGTVVLQSPPAGAEVRKGASVRLQVSTGPQTMDVPDVTGLDEDSARSELEGAGLEVRIVDQETTDPAEDGVVLAQEPAGGTASEGSVVTLTVGRLA